MTAVWPNRNLTFTFMPHSPISYQTEQLLFKKFFDSMYSLESDVMIALWPNDSLTFTLMCHSQIAYGTEWLL